MSEVEKPNDQPDNEPSVTKPKAQQEQKQLTRRQAIRKLGITSGMTAFGLVALDDVTRLVGEGLAKSGNPSLAGAGEEMRNDGAAFAQFAYDPGTNAPGNGPGPVSCPIAPVPLASGHMNTLNGNVHMSQAVTGWGGAGGGLSMSLSYNSQSDTGSAFGPSWTHSFSSNVSPDGDGVTTVTHDDGTEDSYTTATGAFTPPAGVYDQLSQNADGSYLLTRSGGTQYRYAPGGKLASVTDTNGNVTQCAYNNGLLSQVTDPTGRSLSFGYSGSNVSSVTDCVRRTWQFGYTGGLLSSITDPINNGVSTSQSFAYDGFNNLTGHTDRLGKTWGYSYTSLGSLTQSVDPDGNTSNHQAANTSSTPVDANWPSAVLGIGHSTDPNGNQVQYGYGAQLCLLAQRDAQGNQTTHTYDSNNNRLSTKLPSGANWQYSYDAQGNLTSQTDPLNNQTQMTYNGYGQVTSVRDPLGNTTQHTYDGSGNLLQTTDALNNTTQYAYTGGLPTQITDPMGRVTQYAYDGYGNQTSLKDPQGNTTQFAYTTDGLLHQRQDALGRVTNYTYDALGRPTGIAYPTTGNAGVSYAYDAAGRVTQTVDGTGTRTFAYDSWGRKVGMTDPMGDTTAAYDKAGRMLTQTDVSGRTLSYGYDPTARLTSVGDGSEQAQYAYNGNGQPTTVLYPNGVQSAYAYDMAGRVSSLTHTLTSSGAVIVGYAAQYDGAGRLTQVTETPTGDVTTYGYDTAGRLLSERRTGQRPYSGAYTYDASGNRASANVVSGGQTTQNATYAYDTAGRLSQVNDAVTGVGNYTWNPDGTLASLPRPGYTALLGYDEEGRLTGIRHSAGGSSTLAYEYGYGADGGRRWRKDYTAGVSTWWPCGVACGAGSLVERQSDLTGNSWNTSATLLRGNGLVSRATGAGAEYHLPDINGANAVITGETGAVLSSNVYDGFGVQQASQGSALTPYRYGQQEAEGMVRQGSMDYLPAHANAAHKPTRPVKPPTAPGRPKKCPPPPKPPQRNCGVELAAELAVVGAALGAKIVAIQSTQETGLALCNLLDENPLAALFCIAAVETATQSAMKNARLAAAAAAAAAYVAYRQCVAGGGIA